MWIHPAGLDPNANPGLQERKAGCRAPRREGRDGSAEFRDGRVGSTLASKVHLEDRSGAALVGHASPGLISQSSRDPWARHSGGRCRRGRCADLPAVRGSERVRPPVRTQRPRTWMPVRRPGRRRSSAEHGPGTRRVGPPRPPRSTRRGAASHTPKDRAPASLHACQLKLT